MYIIGRKIIFSFYESLKTALQCGFQRFLFLLTFWLLQVMLNPRPCLHICMNRYT